MLQEAFEEACFFGDTKAALEYLKDDAIDPSFNDDYALRRVSQSGHVAIVRALLTDARVDPSSLNNDALVLATWNNRVDVVEVLLKHPRVDPAVDDNFVVRSAATEGLLDVLQALLDDPRVTASDAISVASPESARILATDPRVGIHAYPALYAKHHPELVAEYEQVRGQSRAIVWLMRHDNLGAWEGVAEPLVERLQSFLLY
jgi:hypothetical protein